MTYQKFNFSKSGESWSHISLVSVLVLTGFDWFKPYIFTRQKYTYKNFQNEASLYLVLVVYQSHISLVSVMVSKGLDRETHQKHTNEIFQNAESFCLVLV